MGEPDPVDGFSVERRGDLIILTLSNRYGEGEEYEFPLLDAYRIGRAITDLAQDH